LLRPAEIDNDVDDHMQHSEDFSLKVPLICRSVNIRRRRGFTLIELLVVIAIIGILTALLFPVFATIQENSRQGNTMAHMHDISAGLALYKLDNKAYPPVLFAYACDTTANGVDGCDENDSMQTIGGDTKATAELVGLYPEYVRDWNSFTCDSDANNDPKGSGISSAAGAGTGPQPDYLGTDYALHGAGTGAAYPYRAYFTDDAFDINPEVAGQKELVGTPGGSNNPAGTYSYVLRYQTSWTSFANAYDPSNPTTTGFCTGGCTGQDQPVNENYARQLRWANPPANTYVTAVTYHVATANKLIVLYEGGSVQKVDLFSTSGQPTLGAWVEPPVNGASAPPSTAAQPSVGTVAAGGTCQTSLTATPGNCNYSNATFWQFNNGQ
jgi:prepilin-type N-terminal cleavage/methylation domain-containing protein